MAQNVRRAMMPECEIYKIELAEGENDVCINYLMFCDYLKFLIFFDYFNYRNYLIHMNILKTVFLAVNQQRWMATSCLISIG